MLRSIVWSTTDLIYTSLLLYSSSLSRPSRSDLQGLSKRASGVAMKFELGDLYRDDLEKINEQKRLKREERKALQLLNGGPRKRYPPTHYAHVTQSGRKLMVKEYGSKKQIWNKIGRNDLGTKEYIDFEWNWSEDSDEFGRMDAYWLSENDKATYLPIEFDGRWTLKGRT